MAAIAGERQMFDGDEKEKTKLHEKPYNWVCYFGKKFTFVSFRHFISDSFMCTSFVLVKLNSS